MTAGAAVQKLMQTLSKEQEVIMNISDMLIDIYVAESLLLRVQKLVAQKGEAACAVHIDAMRVFFFDAADRINVAGKNALCSFAEGDEARMMFMGLKRFTKVEPINTKESRRRVAQYCIDENKYCL
jgi:hypothetical protein